MIPRLSPLAGAVACATALTLSISAHAADDGSQLKDRFRVNYAGYLPQAKKTAIYLSDNKGAIEWQVAGTNCKGTEDTYISNDFASGDSFYRIDFSACTEEGKQLTLKVGKDTSAPFSISADPYGKIKYEFFDYFRDHEAKATFTQGKNDWNKELNITFSYVIDAGDNGVYPVNTAEASWALINMLETYPNINTYYSSNIKGGRTVYEQLKVLTEQFYHVFDYGGKLAIPKFHTNVNDSYAACAPHFDGTCVSEPETKATFSTARTLGAMARLHHKYGTAEQAQETYKLAVTALKNAQTEPLTCRQIDSFGGEGGMYPDNDNYSGYRNPEKPRDNCHPGKDNTQDDEYAALVETYLAAIVLKQTNDIKTFKTAVTTHPRFNEVSSYWWGAVAMEGSLSLLSNETLHDIDLSQFKLKLLKKADEIAAYQQVGYPGVTWDAQSDQWDSGDQDDVDNNFRWGSHRMALNDARILMAAAEVAKAQKANDRAANFARSAVAVLDHISGVNAMNLAMFTAQGYPEIENAVMRTHDGVNNDDSWPGKMVLGPNNWTNANDGAMPKFGSQPGLKMFAVTGTGWSSREISIDANASLVPVSYFTTEVAPSLFALSPIKAKANPKKAAQEEPQAPSSSDKKAGIFSLNQLWLLLSFGALAAMARRAKVAL
ncbi:cellulase N-terminal Ig-like domain-containing protein [Marinagarivorans cellulosilyticus]|uniref:Endoglucanase n=1 Tax=Marinagarivorans cellulosilyticus TaxID=2721545 RepID=A0AAN1WH19_9GAMM|nr:cellulase N-terminal Ig-like domain-containing protein [Marinagarivorans cellulosilyticus]BCD97448.1 endoglucanase [Marinagarivorans cellulosilyticus]